MWFEHIFVKQLAGAIRLGGDHPVIKGLNRLYLPGVGCDWIDIQVTSAFLIGSCHEVNLLVMQSRFDNIDMLSIYMAERMSHLHKSKSPGRLYHRVIQISLLALGGFELTNPNIGLKILFTEKPRSNR